jgi:hypothetical protein
MFILRQDERQAILTVFNWTNTTRSHNLKLTELGLPSGHTFSATNVFNQNETVALEGGAVRLENEPPQSVEVIKLIDQSIAAAAPTVTAQVPSAADAGQTIALSAQSEAGGVPAVAYHWDFGDGTSADSATVSHAYTRAGEFTIRLTVEGVDEVPAHKNFSVKITGKLKAHSTLTDNQRFIEPTDH